MRSTKLSLEAKYLTGEIPIPNEILQGILDERGFDSNNLSIRETNRLATLISEKGNIDFVRMEMGIPNIPTPKIAKKAEKEAIDKGLQGIYPPFDGIPELKLAGSKFVKAFLDMNVNAEHVIPTCGSLQGGYISQALAGNMHKGKDTILYLDPTFPVTRYQAKFLGLKSEGLELYDNRGESLIKAIEQKISKGRLNALNNFPLKKVLIENLNITQNKDSFFPINWMDISKNGIKFINGKGRKDYLKINKKETRNKEFLLFIKKFKDVDCNFVNKKRSIREIGKDKYLPVVDIIIAGKSIVRLPVCLYLKSLGII